MNKILNALGKLEIYTTNKVQEWNDIRQKPDNSAEQNRVATAVWETYREMANKISGLGELAENVINEYKKSFKSIEWVYEFNENMPDEDCYYCPCCGRWKSQGHKDGCKLEEFIYGNSEECLSNH